MFLPITKKRLLEAWLEVFKQQYDKELFQIFVVCDNCTDNTEYEASKTQARILVRNNDEEKGKGYALNGLLQEFSLEENYDAICVFDADNVVSGTYLIEMNKMLNDGHEVIQGILTVKILLIRGSLSRIL